MTDIALGWDVEFFTADLLLLGGQIVTDDGLRTAILISLFTDARAPAGAALPEDGADRGGWWGDDFIADGSRADGPNAVGSLLWLLRRSKITAPVMERARSAAVDALGWLIRDGIAAGIDVQVEAQGQRLAFAITLDRPQGPGRQRFDFAWDASTGELS